MTTSPANTEQVYDDFAGPRADLSRWQFLEFPQLDGSTYECSEPNAVVDLHRGGLRVHIERFEKSHSIQPMDNCKYLLLSKDDFNLPEEGLAVFSAEMAARNISATPRDYRDGFAAFVVVDMATGFVFDLAVTSDMVLAIHERLPLPGVSNAFTRIVETPVAPIATDPEILHRCRIMIDNTARVVTWEMDGVTLFDTPVAELPTSMKVGLGIFTLHPEDGQASTSLHGQGLTALWRNVRISI